MTLYDAIVIGGGASGLMCAAVAAQGGKRVLLLEHNAQLGRKILASGGGNCNFTNLSISPEDYRSRNPHFCKSALSRYPAQAFIELIESHGVRFYEKKLGQLFCEEGAERVLGVLVKECDKVGVEIRVQFEAQKVIRKENRFLVISGEWSFEANNLVLATGGLSFKGLGASDIGYRVAAQFGLNRIKTAPALVPLLYGGYHKLAGLSLPLVVEIKDRVIADDFLFTHLGFSGPAILKASLYWTEGQKVTLNFLPDQNLAELIGQARQKGGTKSLSRLLSFHLPSRFVKFWLEKEVAIAEKDLPNLTQKELDLVVNQFQAWSFIPQGTEGYKKAEVTQGGVDSRDISSKTMEAKAVKGLYFIGELLDVTGLLGSYNLHWAWASGHAAGQALAEA